MLEEEKDIPDLEPIAPIQNPYSKNDINYLKAQENQIKIPMSKIKTEEELRKILNNSNSNKKQKK